MKILKYAGTSNVLAEWPSDFTNRHASQILEAAGRTCYQSIKGPITDITATRFIKNQIMTRKHYSVIEHGWRGYIVKVGKVNHGNFVKKFWPTTRFMFITFRDDEVLISANLETWRKLYYSNVLHDINNISKDLESFAPQVFCNNDKPLSLGWFDTVTPITSAAQLETHEEKLAHLAVTIRFDNASRGFTHEIVRHRVPVYSQESTRYVDESHFKVVIPPHKNENEKVIDIGDGKLISIVEWFAINENAYRSLRKAKWVPEDARQVLPIGIKSQIVLSCNLQEIYYIYKKRSAKFAHWEIRRLMGNILEKAIKHPTLFINSFIFDGKEINITS